MPRAASTRATRKIFLKVPFKDREEAQALGAGFEWYKDGQRPEGAPTGYCYIPPGELIAPFAKWRRAGNPFAPDPTQLPATTPRGKNAAAVALGSLGGRAGGHKGGMARARNLSPEELSAIGRKGAAARRAKAEAERREKLNRAHDRYAERHGAVFEPEENDLPEGLPYLDDRPTRRDQSTGTRKGRLFARAELERQQKERERQQRERDAGFEEL